MHECRDCGQACDCDQEDTWTDMPDECSHDCDEPDDYDEEC